MLVSFSLQNWKSFREKQTLSMVGSGQTTFNERVSRISKYRMKILPIAAIYGGNASGKSNLFNAISFTHDLIVKGTKTRDQKIDVQPFLLCDNTKNEPSKFWFTILIDECIYEYYFSATKTEVREEKLTQILSTTEKVLFSRQGSKWTIHNLKNNQQLNYIRESTRDNQLFLTSTVALNNSTFENIYNWFAHNTRLIAPQTQYADLDYIINTDHENYFEANNLLSELDTGIDHLSFEDYEGFEMPKSTNASIDIPESSLLGLVGNYLGEKIYRISKEGKDILRSIVSYHKCEDGSEVKFDLSQESAGSRRLIDVLPAFIGKNQNNVFFIDEFDRSLHHLLLRKLIKNFLMRVTKSSRTQLIFTTHDLLLINQDVFRRDEMYVIERDNLGGSHIIPLNEYKGLRKDKDILKSYLQGRFGGIPNV